MDGYKFESEYATYMYYEKDRELDAVKAELATLRAEVAEWKEYGKDKAGQLVKEQATSLNLRSENERLRNMLERAKILIPAHNWVWHEDVLGA